MLLKLIVYTLPVLVPLVWLLLSPRLERRLSARWTQALLILGGCAYVALLFAYDARNDRDRRRAALGDERTPPYLDFVMQPTGVRMIVSNASDYPAYNVSVELSDSTTGTGTLVATFENPEIAAHTAPTIGDLPLAGARERRFTASIRTRAGTFVEEIVLRRREGGWSKALRVIGDTGTLVEDAHPDFPRNAAGGIDWPPRWGR
jgi:hypothetical protein